MKSLKSCLIETFASNKIEYTPYYLIALLTINMLIVAIVVIGLLYNIGYERQKNRLLDLVDTQSVMIDIVVIAIFRHLRALNVLLRQNLSGRSIQYILLMGESGEPENLHWDSVIMVL